MDLILNIVTIIFILSTFNNGYVLSLDIIKYIKVKNQNKVIYTLLYSEWCIVQSKDDDNGNCLICIPYFSSFSVQLTGYLELPGISVTLKGISVIAGHFGNSMYRTWPTPYWL